jgi:mRNA-degrading endonuclease RelE of RelBE toxin-antitoxin system
LFEIVETDEFRRNLSRLGSKEQVLIRRRLRECVYPTLRSGAFLSPNIKRLQGLEPQTWRYRIGNFRLLFQRAGRSIVMLACRARKDAYR